VLQLNNIGPKYGSKKEKKRVGRGDKTCGRGHKGQKSRSGGTKGPRFEGGQTPLYRRLPKKRGFKNYLFKKIFETVNLSSLERFDKEVDAEILVKAGVIKGKYPLKVLGAGKLTRALKVTANKFSKTAKEAIEKAGGKAVTC